jgi:pilus assembly protein TadC
MIPLLTILVATPVLVWLYRAWRVHERALQQLAIGRDREPPPADVVAREHALGRLRRWLARAGYTSEEAPELFVMASTIALALGAATAWLSTSLVAAMSADLAELPGGVGDTLVAVVEMLPWGLLLEFSLVPMLVVRAARRNRVRDIEKDLPLVLELLAMLAQAGLGLDAALARVIDVQPPQRALTRELMAFQRDLLSGAPRLQALRHLASRADVTSLTVFVAAVIQSEQVGASIAETLRHQADDLRSRRRERALLHAQAMPVQLVLPLITCFLPGIFLSTLGPVLYQMIRVADSVLRPVAR